MADAPTLSAGRLFAGDYRVIERLAEGGMGAVYVVKQVSTGEARALKVMHPLLLDNAEARQRFEQEARVASRVASEHVVELYATGIDESSGAPFIVMELLRGEDLATRLERRGPLSLGQTRELFRQVCEAIAAAHAKGIVHRDLKPSNVFLAESDGAPTVKVLDFGIAKITHAATITAQAATRAGAFLGTPLWMAPEQSEPSKVTPAADVWALGLMLYTALTGRVFWRASENPNATMAEVLRELLVDPIPEPTFRARQQGATFPAKLAPIFRRSVVRPLTTRLPDAAAFWASLDAALADDAPAPLTRPSAPRPAPVPLALDDTSLAKPAPPSAPATRPPAVLVPTPERTIVVPSWLLGLVAAVLIVAAGGLAVRRFARGEEYEASCRLCTIVRNGATYANGPISLRQIRHTIEEQFPAMETSCLGGGDKAGKVFMRFTLREGPGLRGVHDMRFDPRTPVNQCLASAVERIPFEQFGGVQLSGGATDVAYTLEYDPNFRR
jgi:serine/threonine protein kinase